MQGHASLPRLRRERPPSRRAIRCKGCSSFRTVVVDCRESMNGEAIRRRRACFDCGRRFTTYELVETLPLAEVKATQAEEHDRCVARMGEAVAVLHSLRATGTTGNRLKVRKAIALLT